MKAHDDNHTTVFYISHAHFNNMFFRVIESRIEFTCFVVTHNIIGFCECLMNIQLVQIFRACKCVCYVFTFLDVPLVLVRLLLLLLCVMLCSYCAYYIQILKKTHTNLMPYF